MAEGSAHPHDANRAFWDASIGWWKEKEDQRGLWTRAHKEPGLVLSPAEMPFLTGIAGKQVCVLGSGDNEAAFALTGLGGRVTSVDISERRLAVAAERSATLGLSLSFVQADVTDLRAIADNSFDLVYTGGHVSVWVADIRQYYAEAVRILRPSGLFLVNEYHPVRRMWEDAVGPAPPHRYLHRGPYTDEAGQGPPTFEYHWTVADHIQAVLDSGCALVKADEFGEGKEEEDYAAHVPPALPMHLLIVGRKSGN